MFHFYYKVYNVMGMKTIKCSLNEELICGYLSWFPIFFYKLLFLRITIRFQKTI